VSILDFFRSKPLVLHDPAAGLRDSNVDYSRRRTIEISRTYLRDTLRSSRDSAVLAGSKRVFGDHRDVDWRQSTHAELFSLYVSSPSESASPSPVDSVGVALRYLTLPTLLDVACLEALESTPGAEAASWELFHLRVFAVDAGVFAAFGAATPLQRALLDSFYAAFDVTSSSDVLPPWLPERVRDRVNEYTSVLSSASGSALASVGLAADRRLGLGVMGGIGFRVVRDTMRQATQLTSAWLEVT
jgi:hypothetical protein